MTQDDEKLSLWYISYVIKVKKYGAHDVYIKICNSKKKPNSHHIITVL